MAQVNSKEKRELCKEPVMPLVCDHLHFIRHGWNTAPCVNAPKGHKRFLMNVRSSHKGWHKFEVEQKSYGLHLKAEKLRKYKVKAEVLLHPHSSTFPFVSKEWRDLLKDNVRKSRPLCCKPREAILRKQVRPIFLRYPTTSYRLNYLSLHAGSRLLLKQIAAMQNPTSSTGYKALTNIRDFTV